VRRDLGEEALARVRQPEPPWPPVEQAQAELPFEPSDLVAERTDREVQGSCRPGEVPEARGGDEAREGVEGDLAHLE
jgi:hypothetical protein